MKLLESVSEWREAFAERAHQVIVLVYALCIESLLTRSLLKLLQTSMDAIYAQQQTCPGRFGKFQRMKDSVRHGCGSIESLMTRSLLKLLQTSMDTIYAQQ